MPTPPNSYNNSKEVHGRRRGASRTLVPTTQAFPSPEHKTQDREPKTPVRTPTAPAQRTSPYCRLLFPGHSWPVHHPHLAYGGQNASVYATRLIPSRWRE